MLVAHPRFAAINIVGLAVGMAACLLMALWVGHETGHDRWVPRAEQVFVVQSHTRYPGQDPQRWRHASAAMLPRLQQDHAERMQAATRVIPASRALRVGERLANQPMLLVDPGFFDVLPWPVAEGSTGGALAAPGQLVVTDRFVRKWFPQGGALGQTVLVTVKGQPRPFRIAAVLQPLPTASLLDFEAVALLDGNDLPDPALLQNWGNFNALSLVRLKNAADAAALTADADAFVKRHIEVFANVDNGFFYRPVLVPLTESHLSPVKVAGPGRPPGDRQLVGAVAAIGALVLAIAAITYVNLVTARLSLRTREVGLRKTLGARPGQLVLQFLAESLLLAAVAGVLALALVELAMPAFNALLDQQLELRYLGARGAIPALLLMVVLVGLGGGWYPALALSRLRPRAAQAQSQAGGGAVRLRQVLVVGQFAIAVTLMACLAVIVLQLQHLRQADPGYQPEGLAVIANLQRAEVLPRQEALVEALRRVPGVTAASRTLTDPTSGGVMRQSAYLPGVPDAQAPQVNVQVVDWDFVATYGARLLAGRRLTRELAGDDAEGLDEAQLVERGLNVMVNRAALAFFDTRDPQAAIGRSFQMGPPGQRFTMRVVGVLEDIRLRTARDAPEPTFFARQVDIATAVSVRFAGVPAGTVMPQLEAAWKQLFPETPFEGKLVVDAVQKYYEGERRTGALFGLFAALALALCALGLYGLAVFTAERRTREIALRKVMGASTGQMVKLLVLQFSRPVLLAVALATPLAVLMSRTWLEGFHERVALSPWPFVAAGGLALVIAWATVGWHALKVARTPPAQALRVDG